MQCGLNLALFLYAFHQDRPRLLKTLKRENNSAVSEEMERQINNFAKKLDALFAASPDFVTLQPRIENLLVHRAKPNADKLEEFQELEIPTAEDLFSVCFRQALDCVTKYQAVLTQAGKIWWECGYHQRLTMRLLGATPPSVESKEGKKPKSDGQKLQITTAVQRFLWEIVASTGKDEKPYAAWLEYKATLHPEHVQSRR